MANIKIEGLDKQISKLWSLGVNAEVIIKRAVFDGAAVVADEMRRSTPKDTGDLADSLSIAPFRSDNGVINVKINYTGYDRKGVPNAKKAAVLEHGTSKGRKAAPFIRPAVNRAKAAAIAAMNATFDAEVNKIIKE